MKKLFESEIYTVVIGIKSWRLIIAAEEVN